MPRGSRSRPFSQPCRRACGSISNGPGGSFACPGRPRGKPAPANTYRNILMPNLKLTLACWDYDRTRPLMDGRVKPDGIDLDINVLRPRQSFQRMLANREFQVSELSLASYTALKARGYCPFVAVPVALSKIFRRSCIYVRPGSGIRTPQ